MENGKQAGYSRRRGERLKVDFTTSFGIMEPYEVRRQVGSKEFSAKVLDISERGMAILTSFNLPVRTVLSVKFVLTNPGAPNEQNRVKRVSVVGEVRNNSVCGIKERRVGILFTRISEIDRRSIVNLMKQ
jgi:c-di-GMP-binding flagellar brake protein YcgR